MPVGAVLKTANGRRKSGKRRNEAVSVNRKRALPECVDQCDSVDSSSDDESSDATADSCETDSDGPWERTFSRGKSLQPMVEPPQIETFPAGFQVFRQLLVEGDPRARPYTLKDAKRQEKRAWRRRCAAARRRELISAETSAERSNDIVVSSGSSASESEASSNSRAKSSGTSRNTAGSTSAPRNTAGSTSASRNTAGSTGASRNTAGGASASRNMGDCTYTYSGGSSDSDYAPGDSSSAEEADSTRSYARASMQVSVPAPSSISLNGPGGANSEMRGHSAPSAISEKRGSPRARSFEWRGEAREMAAVQVHRDLSTAESNDYGVYSGCCKAGCRHSGYRKRDADPSRAKRQGGEPEQRASHNPRVSFPVVELSAPAVFDPRREQWRSSVSLGRSERRGRGSERNDDQGPSKGGVDQSTEATVSRPQSYGMPANRRVNRLSLPMTTFPGPALPSTPSLLSTDRHNKVAHSNSVRVRVRRAISAPAVELATSLRESSAPGHFRAASDAQKNIDKEGTARVSIGRRSTGLSIGRRSTGPSNADRRSVGAGKGVEEPRGGDVRDEGGVSAATEAIEGAYPSTPTGDGRGVGMGGSDRTTILCHDQGTPKNASPPPPTPMQTQESLSEALGDESRRIAQESLAEASGNEPLKAESPTQGSQRPESVLKPPCEDQATSVLSTPAESALSRTDHAPRLTPAAAPKKARVLERYNTFPEIETSLFEWVLTQIERGVRFTDDMIHEDAHRIARQLHLDDSFHASAYWIEGWKRQFDFHAIHPKSRLRGTRPTTPHANTLQEWEDASVRPSGRKGAGRKALEPRGRKPGVKSQPKKRNTHSAVSVPSSSGDAEREEASQPPQKRRKGHSTQAEASEKGASGWKKHSSSASRVKSRNSTVPSEKKQTGLHRGRKRRDSPSASLNDSSSTQTASTALKRKRTQAQGQKTTPKRVKRAQLSDASSHPPRRRSHGSKGLSRRQVRNILASNAPCTDKNSTSDAEQRRAASDSDSDYAASITSLHSTSAQCVRLDTVSPSACLAAGDSTAFDIRPHRQTEKTLQSHAFPDLGIQSLGAICRPKRVAPRRSAVSPSGSPSVVPDLTQSSTTSIAGPDRPILSLQPLPLRASLRAPHVPRDTAPSAHSSSKAQSDRCGLCGCAGGRWGKVQYATRQCPEVNSPTDAEAAVSAVSSTISDGGKASAGEAMRARDRGRTVSRDDASPGHGSGGSHPPPFRSPSTTSLRSDLGLHPLPVKTSEVWLSGTHEICSSAFEIDYTYQEVPCLAEKRDYPLCKACVDGDPEACIFKNFRMLPKDPTCSFSEGFEPVFERAINTSDDVPIFSEAWYRGMSGRDLRIALSASTALRPTLEREIQHARLPQVAKTTHKLDVSTFCDTCLHSVFSGSWMCSHCSAELCFSCYEDLGLLTEDSPLARHISTAQRERLCVCYGGATHTPRLFNPLVRIPPSLIEKTLREMEELSLNTTKPVNRIAPQSLDTLYMSYSSDFHVSYSQEYMDGTITGYEGSAGGGLTECAYASHAVLSLHAAQLRSLYLEEKDSADTVFEDVFGTDFCRKMDAFSADVPVVDRLKHIFTAEEDSPSEQLPIQVSPSLLSEVEVTHGIFQHIWSIGEPLVYETGKGDELSKKISPEMFIERYGTEECAVLSNLDSESLSSTIGAFFKTFGYLLTPDQLPRYSYKLKDWPPTNDFKNVLPDVFNVYAETLPIPAMTRRDGSLNLAANSPTNSNAPDLGPKGYFSHASLDIEGGTGSTKLHMDVADAVNIMAWAGPDQFGNAGGALWDIYRAEDSDKIRDFIFEVTSTENSKSAKSLRETSDDPIHMQQIYLDVALRKKLYETKGVKPFHIYQRPGQAVFIPAGCAHQVCNVTDCIKVASDFVSHQNVSRCWALSSEFRQQTRTHDLWRSDILALKSQLFWTWQRCIFELEKRFQ